MKIEEMKKEDLELLSNKDITNILLEENGSENTVNLFKKIIKLLDLPASTLDNKIGDYYASLTTDKRFVLLEDGNWDLRTRHPSNKVIIMMDDDDEEMDDVKEDQEVESEDEDFDTIIEDEEEYDDSDDDLKDLVVLDEDELELEQ